MMRRNYIICGKLFDGELNDIRENVKIVTDGKKITEVGTDIEAKRDDNIIDLSSYTVTPGFIDSHAHYEFVGPETFNSFALTDSDEMKTLNTVYNAGKSLMHGFTTVRLTGTSFRGFGCLDAKRVIDKGRFRASRLIVTPHALGVPGGHWDFSIFFCNTNYVLSDFMEQPYAIGSGADMFKHLVRKEIKYGADFIKIMAAGGFASPGDDPGDMQLDRDELAAIINTTRMASRQSVAHAYTSDSIKLLIELGVDEIEHGTLMDAETADLMERKKINYVPTLFSLMPPDDDIDPTTLPPKSEAFVRKLEKYDRQLKESREIVLNLVTNGNILVGLGSDIVGIYPNYDGWREFKAWLDLGIPVMRTLFAATSMNAQIVGRPDLGVIKPGKTADIVAWERDLFTDHRAVSECSFVMKEGCVCKDVK